MATETITYAEPLSTYRGRPQPPINERLEQIYNFLADEDYYRCLDFTNKFSDIKSYLRDLEIGEQENEPCDDDLLERIYEQIDIHDQWTRDATGITPFEFNSPLLEHRNRLRHIGWKPRDGLIRFELEDLEAYPMNTILPEAKLHVTLQEDLGSLPPSEPDPFEYTKKIAKYRSIQDMRAQGVRERYDRNDVDALAFNPLPRNFKGPWAPPAAAVLLRQWEEMREELVSLSKRLIDAHQRAPRIHLTQIISVMKQIFMSSTPTILMKANDFTAVDKARLLILTQPSTHRYRPSYLDAPYVHFVNRVNSLIRGSDFWSNDVESPVKVEILIQKIISMGHLDLDHDTMIKLLQVMNDDGNIRYTSSKGEVRKPLPNVHPEHKMRPVSSNGRLESVRVTESEWVYHGLRLALAIAMLTAQIAKAKSESGYMKRVIAEYSNDLARRLREWEKEVDSGMQGIPGLIDIAVPLIGDANKEELTEGIAAKILQDKIADESNKNWEPRATPETVWNWTRRYGVLTEEHFSTDRWSPINQHVGDLHKENMFLDWARNQQPDTGTTGRYTINIDNQAEYHLPKQKTFFAGDPLMPFGETIQQEIAISRRMDEHLRGVKHKDLAGIYGPEGSYTQRQNAIEKVQALAEAEADASATVEGNRRRT